MRNRHPKIKEGNSNTIEAFASPAFIVGVSRSGTTLLASILNRHPTLCVTPETHYFSSIAKYNGSESAISRDWPRSCAALVADMHDTQDWRWDADRIRSIVGEKFPGIKEAFTAIGEDYAKQQGKPFWIEKTPDHIRHIKQIRELFPEACILHIVRDGRDVADSLTNVSWAPDSFYENLIRWRDEVEFANSVLFSDPLAVTIYYENLIKDPAYEVQRICDFFGVAFYDSLLKPSGNEGILIEGDGDYKDKIKTHINSGVARKWEKAMSDIRRNISKQLAQDTLALMGYENEDPYLDSNSDNGRQFYLVHHLRRLLWDNHIDNFIEELVAKTGYTINDKSYGLCEKAVKPKSIIIYNDLIIDNSLTKSLLKLTYKFLMWQRQIKRIRQKGTIQIWLYHGSHAKSWKFRQYVEAWMARNMDFIMCICGNQASCIAKEKFSSKGAYILHPQEENAVNNVDKALRYLDGQNELF